LIGNVCKAHSSGRAKEGTKCIDGKGGGCARELAFDNMEGHSGLDTKVEVWVVPALDETGSGGSGLHLDDSD
jgi:hypothetical protein